MKKLSKLLAGGVLSLTSVCASAELLWTHTLELPSLVVDGYVDVCAKDRDVRFDEGRVVCLPSLFGLAQKPTRMTMQELVTLRAPKVSGKSPVLVGFYAPAVFRFLRGGTHTVFFYKYE